MSRSLHDVWLLDHVRHDLKLAARSLRRSFGTTVACVVTIALGVGANGAMFSLVDRLFLRPPAGVRDPAHVRRLYLRTTATIGQVAEIQNRFTYPAFAALDSGLRTRVELAAYIPPDTMPLTVSGAASVVHGSYVTGSYMRTLDVSPALGRFFSTEEEVLGAPEYVAVLSYALWQRAFGGSPKVLGQTILINRERATVIGVAPAHFTGADLSGTDIWMPLPSTPAPSDGSWYKGFRARASLRIIARVPGDLPNAWLANAGTTIVRRTPMGGTNVVRDTGAVVLAGPILESLGPSIAPSPDVAISTRLVGVTVIVLLIACANVANLLLARAMTRRRETAVRLALGASRSRIMSQFLTEGIVLGVIAGLASLIVSVWAGGALRLLVTPNTYWTEPALDARVALVTILIALITGLAAGLIPAMNVHAPMLSAALRGGTRGGFSSTSRSLLSRTLLVAQVALCIMLLCGAGLFARSIWRIHAADVGFDAEGVVYATAAFVMPDGNYLDFGNEPATRRALSSGLRDVAQRLGSHRDIRAVALTTGGPMLGYAMTEAYYQDGAPVPRLDERDPAWIASTSNYLEATGIHMLRGRFFIDADRDRGPVVVVNETAARAYWPEQDALGKCLRLFRPDEPCLAVIGIVRNARLFDFVEPSTAQLFTPLGYAAKGARVLDARYLILRTRPDNAERLKGIVSREIQRTFPDRGVPVAFTSSDRLGAQLRPWRTGLALFSAFGALALFVAAFGTYSVISYAVTQRSHEMGVRSALGATAQQIVALVLRECLRVTAAGIIAGTLAAIMAGGVMQSLLYDTSARDPLVIVCVAVAMTGVALVASWIPAVRAARADPMVALRVE